MRPLGWLIEKCGDFLAWLVPGKTGKLLAMVLTGLAAIALMYVANYRLISRFF
jgi:hypothetical protein